MSLNKIDLVRAVHPYACKDQTQGLAFPQGVVLLVAERSDDGWCKGYAAGTQGWFPASYVHALSFEKLLQVCGGRIFIIITILIIIYDMCVVKVLPF